MIRRLADREYDAPPSVYRLAWAYIALLAVLLAWAHFAGPPPVFVLHNRPA